MTKPTIRIHNSETNEVIDREMTDAEFKEYKAAAAADQIRQTELESQLIAKSALLDRLGISESEAKLLLS